MKSCLLLLTLAVILFTPTQASADSRGCEREAKSRLEIDVTFEHLSSIWIEITDEDGHLVASWFAPWDGDVECVSGLCPEVGTVDPTKGWGHFELRLREPGRYRVEAVSLGVVWGLSVVGE